MNVAFYISSVVAIIATILVITRHHPIHALLYLVVSFLSIAVLFISIGAPFVGVLEVIIYAGAIMVLFIFVVMMLNLDKVTSEQEKQWLKPNVWMGPAILCVVLLGEMIYLLLQRSDAVSSIAVVEPKSVSISLFGEYIVAVELTGFLLMAGIVGAAHIGKHKKRNLHRYLAEDEQAEELAKSERTAKQLRDAAV
jgi:NADH-quinone oxidoreductase subunit J